MPSESGVLPGPDGGRGKSARRMLVTSVTTAHAASMTNSSIAASFRASCSGRVRKCLGDTPGRERKDRYQPHDPVSSLGRMSDAHGRDSAGDQQQRSGGHASMVAPRDAAFNPVGGDEQNAYRNGRHPKPHGRYETDTGPARTLNVIHTLDGIEVDLQLRSPVSPVRCCSAAAVAFGHPICVHDLRARKAATLSRRGGQQ